MSSTNKTTNFNLNQWIGSDIPKRADFNSDNATIDNALGTHVLNNSIHITAEERAVWNTQTSIGFYIGTGLGQVSVNVGFEPKAVIAFSYNKPLGITANSETYSAIATSDVPSLGIEITQTGFKVYDGTSYTENGVTPKLNATGLDYAYIAFK